MDSIFHKQEITYVKNLLAYIFLIIKLKKKKKRPLEQFLQPDCYCLLVPLKEMLEKLLIGISVGASHISDKQIDKFVCTNTVPL